MSQQPDRLRPARAQDAPCTARRTEASRPAEQDASGLLDLMAEVTLLTRLPRTGWLLAGVSDGESVTDHAFETAILAYVFAKSQPQAADAEKVLLMALFHDVAEARTSDLPKRAKPYFGDCKPAAEARIIDDILPEPLCEVAQHVAEMKRLETPEARIVDVAHGLQNCFKALVYAKENNGDMTEYLDEIAEIDCRGIRAAELLKARIEEKLRAYLGHRPAWRIGYDANL